MKKRYAAGLALAVELSGGAGTIWQTKDRLSIIFPATDANGGRIVSVTSGMAAMAPYEDARLDWFRQVSDGFERQRANQIRA